MRARLNRSGDDPGSAELGRIIQDLQDRVRDIEQADQGGQRSIDDAALEVYDDDDQLRGRVGKQPDGGFAVKAFGKTPQTPTEPDVIPVPGGCIVEWDGTFEDAQTDDIQRIAIHVGEEPGFQIVTGDEGTDEVEGDEELDADSTEKGAITSPRGGSAFLALDPGVETYYVRLTAVAEGGAESPPTDAVEVIVAASEAAFYQDEFILATGGAQQLGLTFTPLDYSDHLYWNGLYQREDLTWTRIGKKVTLTGAPYLPKAGDSVTVEYAYLLGEEPEKTPLDGHALRWSGPILGTYVVDSTDTTEDWMITALIRLNETISVETALGHSNSGYEYNWAWSIQLTTEGQAYLRVKNQHDPLDPFGGYVWARTPSFNLNDGKAHHLAWGFNVAAKLFQFWVDAELVGSGVVSNQYVPGGQIEWGQYTAGHDLDEWAAFPHLLTESEIADQYAAWGEGRYPGTIIAQGASLYGRLDDEGIILGNTLLDNALPAPDYAGQLQNFEPAEGYPHPALQKGD